MRYGSRPVLARSSAVVFASPSLASDFFAQTVIDLLRIRSPLTVFVSEAEAVSGTSQVRIFEMGVVSLLRVTDLLQSNQFVEFLEFDHLVVEGQRGASLQ